MEAYKIDLLEELKPEYGIIEFLELFQEDFCKEYLKDIRFPDGEIFCPHCGSWNPYLTAIDYKCSSRGCNRRFNIKTGTVFSNAKLPLKTWFFLIYQNSVNKKNISSVQHSKNLGITQKTAWNMQHKIRSRMWQDPQLKLSGIVEVDEAFVSKPHFQKNNWGGLCPRKAPILGLVERGGKVVIAKIPNRKAVTLKNIIREYIEEGSKLYTDGWAGYLGIRGYEHETVAHHNKEWVRGDVHINTIENVWSGLKKSIRNAHHSVSDKNLQGYLDEAAFRFNTRDMTQMERFNEILRRCAL